MKIQQHLNEIDKLIEWGENLGEWEYRIPKIKKHLKQISKKYKVNHIYKF